MLRIHRSTPLLINPPIARLALNLKRRPLMLLNSRRLCRPHLGLGPHGRHLRSQLQRSSLPSQCSLHFHLLRRLAAMEEKW